MKRTLLALSVAAVALSAGAAWRNLDDANWYSGPKISGSDLAGKVVLVDEWGVNCPPCRALLPRMQAIWSSFGSKPFVLIGSHRQGRAEDEVKKLVSANKLTYPVYYGAGLAEAEPSNGGGLPFMYVVDHRGRVVYSGRDERAATEAVVNAIGQVGAPPSVTGGFIFTKKSPWKMYEKQLVLGKNVSASVKKLEKAVKDAEKKSANPKQKEAAGEARMILDAIAASRKDIKADIENARKSNPEEAYNLASLYVKSFPEEKELKEALAVMKKEAVDWKAAQKGKAK